MSKQKKTLYAVVIVLGIVILGLAASVFAKYISTLEDKAATASVAQWKFRANNESSTLSCDPAKTYNANTLVNGKIAPGTSGTCTLDLSNAGGEVGVRYTITISEISKPTNLIIKDSDNNTLSRGDEITGLLAPDQSKTITINWEWPYETTNGDTADTADGETAGKTMGVTFSIQGVQVEPVE